MPLKCHMMTLFRASAKVFCSKGKMQGVFRNVCRQGSALRNLSAKHIRSAEASVRPHTAYCFDSGAPVLPKEHDFESSLAANFPKTRGKSSNAFLSPCTIKETPTSPTRWNEASMVTSLLFDGGCSSVFSRAIATTPTVKESQVEGGTSSVVEPTQEVAPRIKFKRLSKTAKHIMQILDVEAVQAVKAEREIPNIKPGHIVQLKVEVPENKRRVSVLKGIVIARRNAGLNSTFRIRRIVAGVGVESVFPLYSPNIKEMKVLDQKKVRRAKLYYLRDTMVGSSGRK